MNYYFNKTLNLPYSDVREKVIEALKAQGFGVLTEIDIQATLKKKLDVDFYRYEILGACHPQFAHQALQAEDKIGTMLPCNVILQQKETNGPVEVSAIDPASSMAAIKNNGLDNIAAQVRDGLKQVVESL